MSQESVRPRFVNINLVKHCSSGTLLGLLD
jgi:hypothetical protein